MRRSSCIYIYIYMTRSSFSEIDSSIVLLVRQVSTRRRACQPERATKHQQINSKKNKEN